MNVADPHAARASQGGKEPTSVSLLPLAVPILAAQYAAGTSASTVRLHKDEEELTEYDRLSLYLPFDHTWSPPPLTDPDCDENSRSSQHYSKVTSSTSLISRLQSFATSSTSVNSSATNQTAWCSTAAAPTSRYCSACHRSISGQFVRALGTVFHFDCFRCADCNIGVASGFFPLQGSNGKLQPLCERDHYRRRDLTCAKCKQALKGKYIAACNKKFHPEHFTCSVCSELLKPQGAWNGNGDVYCLQHYSIWSATKCTGCGTFVENPLVEIELGRGKRWHRECYLLNKFWDIRLAGSALQGRLPLEIEAYTPGAVQYSVSASNKIKISAEALVHRMWAHLSKYDESSLACLDNIARHVSDGFYLLAISVAKELVVHIEVLFAAIEELERAGVESLSQNIYVENLFNTAFDLIEALSGAQYYSPTSNFVQFNSQRRGAVQALLAGFASHHKNIMIVTLNGVLNLKHDTPHGNVLLRFLDRLQRLARDGAYPNADRRMYPYFAPANISNVNPFSSKTTDLLPPPAVVPGPSIAVDIAYGYQSLGPQHPGDFTTSPSFALGTVRHVDGIAMILLPSDACSACQLPIKEGCVRRAAQRWHFHCFACTTCRKSAKDVIDACEAWERSVDESLSTIDASSEFNEVRPPTYLINFQYGFSFAPGSPVGVPGIYCTAHVGTEFWDGSRFEAVSRLEQYAFLLYMAIKRSQSMPLWPRRTHASTEISPMSENAPLPQPDTILGRLVDTFPRLEPVIRLVTPSSSV